MSFVYTILIAKANCAEIRELILYFHIAHLVLY